MNVVDESIITTILTAVDPSPVKILRWNVDNNIIKAGNNYSSEVSRLTVQYERNDVQQTKILFLKVPSNSPSYQSLGKLGAYDKELLIYTEVIPKIYTFEDEYFTARHYYFDDKHSLFLKDLSQSGYKCADRVAQLDFQHCFYALRSLAKLHAFSVKIHQTYGLPEKVKQDTLYNRTNTDEDSIKLFLSGIDMFVDTLPATIRTKYARQLATLKSIEWNDIWPVMVSRPDSFNVLVHGDFWANNVMFKYDKYGNVRKTKLIDFQLSRWANPAIDLIHFTVTSMRYDVYEKHFALLLQIYSDTLNKILTSLGCRTYPMDELVRDIEIRHVYACLIFCCILPLIFSDVDDPIDLAELSKDDTFNMNAVAKCFKRKCYRDIATTWFIHYAEKGVLDS